MDFIKNELESIALSVDSYLDKTVRPKQDGLDSFYEAVRYSLLDAGKRIRPFLVISFAEALGGDKDSAMPFAAALEMIHTYSLIHDDLPCMDDDDYRRGKLSNHKKFGEDVALLAGDALLTKAFEVAAESDLPPHICVKAISCLAQAAGADGMIGGQVLDLAAEINAPNEQELMRIYSLKTGALLRVAARLGCLSAQVDDDSVLEKADIYAKNIGLTFQIIDDILDKYGDEQTLGKPIGSDDKNGKTTYLSFYSKEDALARAESLTDAAIIAVSDFPSSKTLSDLALYLLRRNK